MPKFMERSIMSPMDRGDRPLAGLTVLVVEDSRFASEAVRLLCLKSGARIRRADSLASAARHLLVYQPSVLIIDLGLPDGSGVDLIKQINASAPRIPVILATSGDDSLFDEALSSGADGVLTKPIESLAIFQRAVLNLLPEDQQPTGLRVVPTEVVVPDPIAFHDDLAHVSELLSDNEEGYTLDYAAHFLIGVARSAHDDALETAAQKLADTRTNGQPFARELATVAGMIHERLESRAII